MFKNTIVFIIIGAIFAVSIYFFKDVFFNSPSEFDLVEKENTKMIIMVNDKIKSELNKFSENNANLYICKSYQNADLFLKSVAQIETYARYGVRSETARNKLDMRITFTDATTQNNIYTGNECSGFLSPCLLLKIEMKDRKATRVFTNGQEMNGSPDWIIPDISAVVNSVISYDLHKNPQKYYYAKKTASDFKKEWENK